MRIFVILVCGLLSLSLFGCGTGGQKSDSHDHSARPTTNLAAPDVIQIDDAGLRALLKPNGRPRLINFWATWCGPCREEFPDLVQIAAKYKDKIDVVTVSWDEPSEIDGAVPQFLGEMQSDSPAYLLKTSDQDAAITLVSPDWQGALPFTILLDRNGETVYSKQAKFDKDILTAAIEKL